MHDFTWFGWISDKVTHHNTHVVTASFVALILIIVAFVYRSSLKSIDQEVVPDKSFSLKNLLQVTVEWLLSLMEGVIGPTAKHYFPLIGSIFLYVFLNNLMGVFPGFLPATENINTTLALGLVIFIYYNFVGIKIQGFANYIKHFMGPVWALAWLIFPLEIIGHIFRPISLGVRLFGNITGDHVVLGIFSGLVPLFVPIIFLVLGIFVALVQAFVMALLTAVYIGLAVSHDDHDHGHAEVAHEGH